MSIYFYDHSSFQEDFNKLKEAIDFVQNKVIREVEMLNNQINLGTIKNFQPLFLEKVSFSLRTNFLGKKQIEMYIPLGFCEAIAKQNPSSLQKQLNLSTNTNTLIFDITPEGYEKCIKILEEIAQLDANIHQQNVLALKNNQKIFETIVDFVTRTGIKKEYYGEVKINRKKKSMWIEHEWVKDIRKQIPLDYSPNHLDALLKNRKEKLTELYNKERSKIEREAERKRKEQERKEAMLKMAKLLLKYNLPDNATPQELLKHILEQDKYLYLAHYLHMNRGDWSDGCLYAEKGLDFFRQHMDTNNPVDIAIENEISKYVDNWSDYEDGRIFRDCDWNYDRLYEIAKQHNDDLYTDYCMCLEIIDKLNTETNIDIIDDEDDEW